MTTETRTSALDPFLTTRAQFDLTLAPPEPQLLIDGDNQIVLNTVVRTDDPAVLITGSNNTFINQTGATLTGTGVDPSAPDAAIEISGVGNRVENQAGATIGGTGGVFSSAADTDVVNDGNIIAVDSGSPFSGDRGFGVQLGSDSSVVNRGLVSAEGVDLVRAVSVGDRAVVGVRQRYRDLESVVALCCIRADHGRNDLAPGGKRLALLVILVRVLVVVRAGPGRAGRRSPRRGCPRRSGG